MTHRCRGTNSGIGIVEGGGEKGVWEYLRRDHGWSEQFPENISIIFMVIIYSNVRDQRDSRFSRILENFFSFSLLVLDLEPFQFHFHFSKKSEGILFFTFHFSKKVKAICISLFFLEKKE